MATSKKTQGEPVSPRIVSRLGTAFEQLEESIRERAYHIFRQREPQGGDSTSDWLQAQMELLNPMELEVKEQKKTLVVEGTLQGFSPKEIEIEVGGDQLRVFGSHTGPASSGASGGKESSYFFQSLSLPCEVDADKCTAKLHKNGKLKITLPRVAPEK